MNIISISDARARLPSIISKANKTLNKIVVTVKGKPKAVIMSHAEYESLMETLDILSDSKALSDIRKSIKEIKAGKYVSLDELQKELGVAA